MSEPTVCPRCTAPLPADAPGGLCPKCLAQAIQADEPSSPDDAPGLTTSNPPAGSAPGSRIGRYKLLQPIGEGGMGIVYLAEQVEPVRRKVALKIIKPGLDTRHVIARFEAERQALALMDHQHIARVLDAGTTEGEPGASATGGARPFFVMELVKGVPITEYCDKNQLSIRERLELFIPVCQAIQHAHQKGIIHRDIKPSNVLVCLYDGKPVPKVIDFGVAKAIEQPLVQQTLFTQYGQIVGTLEYMSPEQAELNQLDVDTRSDIYSLGVLLYELLTGTTPLTKADLRRAAFTELLRLIREAEPERPSTRLSHSGEALATISAQRRCEPEKLPRLLRGELDWIVLKSLEKDRTRRYATAADLARDVERHLRDESVEACPPSLGYRLRKTARRYRFVLGTAAAFSGLLVAGLTASTWLAVRATQAEDQAVADRGKAVEAEQVANAEARQAVQAKHREEQARQAEAQRAGELRDALRRSEGLRLTAQSSVVLRDNPGLALLLAIEGARRGGRSPVHNNALLAALTDCRELRTLRAPAPPGHPQTTQIVVRSAKFSRHGGSIITTTEAVEPIRFQRGNVTHNLTMNVGAAQVWTSDGRLVATIVAPPHQYFEEVALSPDGRLLAGRFAGSSLLVYDTDTDWQKCERWLYSDRVVRIWDVSTGKELHVLRGHRDRVVAISFSPDGRRLLTASWDKTCRVWNVQTGRQLIQIASEAALEAAAFSPDGRRVLTVSSGLDRDATYEDDPRSQNRPQKVDVPLTGTQAPARVLQVQTAGQTRGSRGMATLSMTVKLPLLGDRTFKRTPRSGVRLWDAATGKEIAAGIGVKNEPECADVVSAAFSTDSRQVVAATRRGTVLCLSAEDGGLRRYTGRGRAIRSIAWSRDGRRLLLVYEDNGLAVQAADMGEELRSWPSPTTGVRAALLSADGQHVLVVRGGAGADPAVSAYSPETRTVSILDVATGKETAVLKGHDDDVTSVSLSPDGRQILTASLDGTARLWQEESPDYGVVLPSLGPAASAVFSPDGRYLFVANAQAYGQDAWDSFGTVWETATGKRVASLRGQDRPGASRYARKGFGGVRVAQFSPDGKRLLTVSADRRLGIIKPDVSGNVLFTTSMDKWPLAEDIPATPVRVWDVETGRELLALQGLKASIRWAAFSPDGRRILTLSDGMQNEAFFQFKDGKTTASSTHGQMAPQDLPRLHIWDAASGKLVWTVRDALNPHSDWGPALAWRSDSRTIAAGHLAGMLDLEGGTWTMVGGFHFQDVPLFSPDGRYLLGRTGSEASLYDLATLQPTNGWTGGAIELGRVGPDGRASVKTLERGDTRRCNTVKLVGHDGPITAAAFSPDSRWLVTASADRTARIWELPGGKLHQVLRGHLRGLNAVAFSPDGGRVVTASDDHTARIWDTATGRELFTFSLHRGPVRTSVFSPDGSQVLTASDDGTARLWPADPLPIARQRQPRELTAEERSRFAIAARPNGGSTPPAPRTGTAHPR